MLCKRAARPLISRALRGLLVHFHLHPWGVKPQKGGRQKPCSCIMRSISLSALLISVRFIALLPLFYKIEK